MKVENYAKCFFFSHFNYDILTNDDKVTDTVWGALRKNVHCFVLSSLKNCVKTSAKKKCCNFAWSSCLQYLLGLKDCSCEGVICVDPRTP